MLLELVNEKVGPNLVGNYYYIIAIIITKIIIIIFKREHPSLYRQGHQQAKGLRTH
jgi:hypothetical protein